MNVQVGWRIWRVRGDELHSWAARYVWTPDANEAVCLAADHRCPRPPGRGCMCGFWALSSPLRAIRKAREERSEWAPVLGLVRGWGDVALHGREGFRAEHAAVACLFTDWPWSLATVPCPDANPVRAAVWELTQWTDRMRRRRERGASVARALPQVAAAYGVPLLSLREAVRYGVLRELGADPRMVEDASRWTAAACDTALPGRVHACGERT